MSTVIKPGTYHPLGYLVYAYVNAAGRPFTGGKAQRELMAHQARVTGECEGVATGVAALLNQERGKAFPRLEWIPEIQVHDVQKWLDSVVERVKEDKAEKNSLANDKEISAEDRKARLKVIEDEQWTWILEGYDALINVEELREADIERRREAILSGAEQPTEEDREWITERAEKARREAEELARILMPDNKVSVPQ
jgi:hypothetical protein